MSSILGLKTNAGKEAIVLAADTQLSFYDEDNKPTKKKSTSKIRVGRNYAIAFAGVHNKDLEAFFSYLQGNREFDGYLKFIAKKRTPAELQNLAYLLNCASKSTQKRAREIAGANPQALSPIENSIREMLKNEKKPTEIDSLLIEVFNKLKDVKSPVEEAIGTGVFQEFGLYNRYAYKKRKEENDDDDGDETELILAVNSPELELYNVDPYGNVTAMGDSGELEYLCMGSGSDEIRRYIDEEQYDDDPALKENIKLDNITIPVALRLAIRCLKRPVSKDVTTGGIIELVLVTENRIEYYGDELKTMMENAEKKTYEAIIRRYLPEPEKPSSKE